MKASELIGQLAIRTAPVNGPFAQDYSFASSPIEIVCVTGAHILYRYPEGSFENDVLEKRGKECFLILDCRWNDDNWIPYSDLVDTLLKQELKSILKK